MKKIVFVVNNPNFFVSHRMPIGLSLIEQGYEVHIIGPGDCPNVLLDYSFKFHSVLMMRKGLNPFTELSTIFALYRLFKKIQPDLVHLVTIKPYLYGGIAARLAKVPSVVSAVAGLGTVFIDNSLQARNIRNLLWFIYRFAFGHKNQKVIFQNLSDKALLTKWVGFTDTKTVLISGSGVDLNYYQVVSEAEETPIVTLVARLLVDKGVIEFVEAARILKERNIPVRMCLVGDLDKGNRTSVTQVQLDDWVDKKLVEIWGYRKDINQVYSQSNIACLPSYREGLPKSLVEAAACGRAVVTTDVPGCRDAIVPDLTGVLIPIRDSEALADAIQGLIENPDKRKAMGNAGRELAENVFDVNKVVEQHLNIYRELFNKVT